jgi:hypothetical protein
MTIHLAGLIEARSDEEMPERIAFCGFKIHLKGFDSHVLSLATVDWLTKQAKLTRHNEIVAEVGANFKE